MKRLRESNERLATLEVIIIGLLFFGAPCFFSIQGYFNTIASNGGQRLEWTSLKTYENYATIFYEIGILALTFSYLQYTEFRFSALNFRFSWDTIPIILALFVSAALLSDLGTLISSILLQPHVPSDLDTFEIGEPATTMLWTHITPTWIGFALLNGFFEELYFMGIVFLPPKKQQIYVIFFSIFLRFLFHIYLGIPAAIGVMCMGIVFLLVRRKTKSLLPFVLTHSLFDIFGVGLMHWVLYFTESSLKT